MNCKFKTMINQGVVAAALLMGSTLAGAATVSVAPVSQDVFGGDTVTVNINAVQLVSASGGSMDIAWDPTVLSMNSAGPLTDAEVNIADVVEGDGPWDDPDLSSFSDRGVLTSGLLSGMRVGTFTFVTGAAPLATLTFTALNVNGSTSITVSDGAGQGGGWSPPGMLYDAGTVNVQVIPIPAAVWLFGSGLLGMVGVARRRRGKEKAVV